jgi:hypothetical protein
MTTSSDPDFSAWLDLCRNPACDGLYFLGPKQDRITFYSQQVRALRLVHALVETNALKPNEKVAVVGAGIAGVTAAVAFALSGVKVTLYDPAADVLQLQSGSARFLHPHIYEWPAMGSLDDQAGLPILDWTAGTGKQVVDHLRMEFESARTILSPKLIFEPGKRLTAVTALGANQELIFNGDTSDPRHASKVVLAMGFGEEKVVEGAETIAYWKSGSIETAAQEAVAGTRCFVSGGGDGGLTDVMALMVSKFEHVAFARELLESLTDDGLTSAADRAFAGKSLDDDLQGDFDDYVLPVLKRENVLTELKVRLRTDRALTINTSGPLFAYNRAARLNQILTYALIEAAKSANLPISITNGVVLSAPAAAGLKSVQFKDGHPGPLDADRVICRHGSETDACYNLASDAYQAHLDKAKATLTEKPVLGSPLVLEPRTFDFFDQLRRAKLVNPATATALKSAASRLAAMLEIADDAGSHRLSEKGAITLAGVAEACERGTACEIHLTVHPDRVPFARDLGRLAKASGALVTLTADPTVHAAWTALNLNHPISSQPSAGARYRPRGLSTTDLKNAIDASLFRLLDAQLAQVFATGSQGIVGKIDVAILTGVATTWSSWRASLDADENLRSAFLQWLYSVDPRRETFWPGERSGSDHLVAALILILATHLGEALTPANLAGGNLTFGSDATALGSGCQMLNDTPLFERNILDWNAQAVILSGVSDVPLVDPADHLSGAGADSDLRNPRNVRPAMIVNAPQWRTPLKTGLAEWTAAVQAEFREFKARQDKAVNMKKADA